MDYETFSYNNIRHILYISYHIFPLQRTGTHLVYIYSPSNIIKKLKNPSKYDLNINISYYGNNSIAIT
jgi:hypothetical protein